MSESKVEKYLTSRVKSYGGKCLKFVSPGSSGVPDRIVLLPGGRVLFVEVKSTFGEPSIVQEFQIRKLKALGFSVYLVSTIEQVDDFIRKEVMHYDFQTS